MKKTLISSGAATSFYPFAQRAHEVSLGNVSIKKSQSLTSIYALLSQENQEAKFTYSKAIPIQQIRDMKFDKQTQYKQYNGRAPIENGSYFLGTSRRGGVLGDIFIDLDAKEFDTAKQKLNELKLLNLAKSELIARFLLFFRDKILDQSPSTCLNLQRSYGISKAAGIFPLSALIYLGHGDCRPHALAVTALLNDAGIKCEYANFKERMHYREKDGTWSASPLLFDHSIAIYTDKDGEQYIADSYFEQFNNLKLSSLLKGVENKESTEKYQFIEEHAFPISFVKDTTISYNNIDFSIRAYGKNGGISLVANAKQQLNQQMAPQAIKDLGTFWNIKQFERGNAPVKIGTTPDKEAFTVNRGIRVLDMPIRLRGNANTSTYKIPSEISMFQKTIQMIIDHAHSVVSQKDIEGFNTYLTIDQTCVEKGTTQRKPGIHTDGFQGSNTFNGATINYGYIVSNFVPTAFYTNPFYLNHLDSRVHNFNDEMDLQGKDMIPQLTDEFGIYFINAYSPHAAVNASQSGFRTFLRIIFDEAKYNRYGNSINHLLNYQWKMIPNTNISQVFQYYPPSLKESLLIAKIKEYRDRTCAPPSELFLELMRFYDLVKNQNICKAYNYMYRIFSLDCLPLSALFLSILSTQKISNYTEVRLLFIPLASTHVAIRKQAESLIYNFFQEKVLEEKQNEISGLLYEITNDPHYKVNKEQFQALVFGKGINETNQEGKKVIGHGIEFSGFRNYRFFNEKIIKKDDACSLASLLHNRF